MTSRAVSTTTSHLQIYRRRYTRPSAGEQGQCGVQEIALPSYHLPANPTPARAGAVRLTLELGTRQPELAGKGSIAVIHIAAKESLHLAFTAENTIYLPSTTGPPNTLRFGILSGALPNTEAAVRKCLPSQERATGFLTPHKDTSWLQQQHKARKHLHRLVHHHDVGA